MGNDTSVISSQSNSNSSNHTFSRTSPNSSYSLVLAILTILPVLIIIVIIILGNALVIFAVLRDDRLKNKVQNWLILSLSVADLLVGLLVMPLTLTYEILGHWTLGIMLCEIWLALDVLFVTASILNLCVISIDRYWSLTNPIYSASKRTRLRTSIMIACIWCLAFAICLPPLAGWRPGTRKLGECELSKDPGYVLYSSFGSFYIPLIILIFIYAKIFQITRRRAQVQRRKVRQRENLLLLAVPVEAGQQAQEKSAPNEKGIKRAALVTKKASVHWVTDANAVGTTTCALPASPTSPMDESPTAAAITVPPKNEQKENDPMLPGLLLKPLELQLRMMQHKKQCRKRERQATVLLGLILGAFTISWFPFFCMYTLGALCCKPPELLFDVIFWMGYCNSAINPFIYNWFNPEFRLAFRKILCGRQRRVCS